MKKSLIASLLALASFSSFASSYYVVVPVKGRTSATADAVRVTLNGYSLPTGLVGTPYAGFDLKTLLSVAGDPAYSGYGVKWSVASGSLPAGLTLNADGTISGTPTATGTGAFQVKATYKTKGGVQSYQIVVADITVALAAGTPPEAVVGKAYLYDLKQLLSVTGDSAYNGSGVAWSVVADTLPAGLQLKTDGTITGTPTAGGNGSLTARATYKGRNGDQTFQVVSLDIKVALATATLPPAKVSTSYAPFDFKSKLTVTGDPAYTANNAQFTAYGLPQGLTLLSTGVLTGTPAVKNTAGGQFSVVASYKNVSNEQFYTIVVNGLALQVKQVYAGYYHSCAVTPAGAAVCWGANWYGQLGDGTTTNRSTPAVVSGLSSGVASIYPAQNHTCALTTAGGVKCWGEAGELGASYSADKLTPVDVPGLTSGVKSLSAREYHTCAVTSAGGVKCWGDNYKGQLGVVTTQPYSDNPVDVPGVSGATAVAAGDYHSCALLSSGSVMCWGRNNEGEMGNGTTGGVTAPVAVAGLTGVTALSAGGYHTCAAVVVNGTAGRACWGDNYYGELGDGTNTNRPSPVTTLDGSRIVSAGEEHTCAVTGAGAARCWGGNSNGELGYGTTVASTGTTVNIPELTSGVQSISAGSYLTCATLSNGEAKCWGSNPNGELGDGTTTERHSPVDVLPLN